MITAGNQVFQKQANLALVLKTIREEDNMSRISISRFLGLKKSTVTNIVGELLEMGLVVETSQGSAGTGGGRRPVYLRINALAGHILGIEMESGFFRAVLCDFSGKEVWRRSEKLTPKDFSAQFDEIYETTIKDVPGGAASLVGIGVAVAGVVDLENGIIRKSYAHDLSSYPYKEMISDRYEVPVIFENDTNCGSWGELWTGRNSHANFMYLLVRFHLYKHTTSSSRPGIGLGMVMDGKVYHGAGYRSGEFAGDNWTAPGSEYLGMTEAELRGVSSDSRQMHRFLVALLRKISVTLSLVDPARLVLAGDIAGSELILPRVLEELADYGWFRERENRDSIEFSDRNSSDIALGAAHMVLMKLFSVPQLGRRREAVGIGWQQILDQMAG